MRAPVKRLARKRAMGAKIRFKDAITGRWVTQQVVEVKDLRPRWDIVRFVTDRGHCVRREDCIELPEESPWAP